MFDWLNTYTFPTEAAFGKDLDLTHKVYSSLVTRLLALGTTTAAYFTTLSLAACNVLVDVVQEAGQRAVLGKVRHIPGTCTHALQRWIHLHNACHREVGNRTF